MRETLLPIILLSILFENDGESAFYAPKEKVVKV
jgi:hypothetical protein